MLRAHPASFYDLKINKISNVLIIDIKEANILIPPEYIDTD